MFPFLFLRKVILGKINKYSAKNFDKNKAYWASINTSCGDKWIMPKEMYDEVAMLPFEGEEYPVPKNYHEWLVKFYSPNYMTPPPESMRKNHDFIVKIR